MNATIAALHIYKHVRENPQNGFTIKDFYDANVNVADFSDSAEFTEKRVRTAFDNLIESGLVKASKESGGATLIQYAPDDNGDISNEEKRKAIINAIAGKQYKDLYFDTATEENPFLEPENKGQAQWMNRTTQIVAISEKQKIMLDTGMLDHFITMVEHYQNRVWSMVYLLDENEERFEAPLEISFVKMVLQDKHFHCLAIKKTDTGYTGDKFFLNDIDSIEEGERLSRTNDYKELASLFDKIDSIPDFFSQN